MYWNMECCGFCLENVLSIVFLSLPNILERFFLFTKLVDLITITFVYFWFLLNIFLACYLDLREIIFILFPSVKGSLSNFASNLSKLINFYSPWN